MGYLYFDTFKNTTIDKVIAMTSRGHYETKQENHPDQKIIIKLKSKVIMMVKSKIFQNA